MGFQQGFRINTNTSSLDTYRNYSASQAGMERNIERLSSGLRINKAADDAAGLAISERMSNQVRSMQQANRNVLQANNMLQTAEGGMNEIGNILGRMRELAVQSASDTVSGNTATGGAATGDRASLEQEFTALSSEITRIASSTEYNGFKLLDGSFNGKKIQVGTGNTNDVDNISSVAIADFRISADYDSDAGTADTNNTSWAAGSGGQNLTTAKLTVANTADAQSSIDTLDSMINALNTERSNVGALQNRLEYTSSNLMSSIQNNANSMSTIRDADFAAEAADLAKNQILVQSGTAMLAQANGISANVFQLIR